MNVWIMDGDDALGRALADSFASANHQVVMHSRVAWQQNMQADVDLLESAFPADHFASWFGQRGTPDCVIFNIQAKDELELLRDDGDVEMLAHQISNDLPHFLREIQAIAMLLARAGQGNPHPVTPWGVPTKGYKTRKNKRTQSFIVRDRRS